MASRPGPVELKIRDKLRKFLEPSHLETINESHLHNMSPESETHFKIVVVSKKFEDLPSLQRHRLVNDALREEMRTYLRALSIVAKTPNQWQASGNTIEVVTPNFTGGFEYLELTSRVRREEHSPRFE